VVVATSLDVQFFSRAPSEDLLHADMVMGIRIFRQVSEIWLLLFITYSLCAFQPTVRQQTL
jgi:hypothetical protein